MNPYNNNPFETDNSPRELHSERDANLAMAKEKFNNRFDNVVDNYDRYTKQFANGMCCAIIDCALDHGTYIDTPNFRKWANRK
jgi:hypothetical protein